MEWFLWMLGVAILGVAAVASSGRLGELPPPVTSTPAAHLPAGELTAGDLRATRFSVVARGYSMAQVDDLLERLAGQLERSHLPSDRAAVTLPWSPSGNVGPGAPTQADPTRPTVSTAEADG